MDQPNLPKSYPGLRLFIAAFSQVGLVAMNVVFISKGYLLPMFITGFGISFIWTFNVKRIAFGNMNDKLLYALGAGLGTIFGNDLAKFLIVLL